MKTVRCAIYTRKSSDEGLEQGFNSLDAQREACAAYILSQASEGWTALPDIYDDGGISGGTLERPALQRLLADIAAGRIDIIVVYKVDRLTRSLLDFSKLVEAFDKANVSFVSITQSFNTTTSMGRLTLNMLLSFAQFEREVTAERIRDKIAASKAKGMWMGGTPPLGYEPDGRSLKVVAPHAAIVRDIFQRYLALGNVRHVAEQLAADGIGSPVRIKAKTGQAYGGLPLSRGQIYNLLKCPTYVGEVHHNGQVYAGLHDALIDRDTWDRTQALLASNLQGHRSGERASQPSLLAGKLVDEASQPLIATHACKGRGRYRYYVSRALHHEGANRGMRVPAPELEKAVANRLADALADPLSLIATAALCVEPAAIGHLIEHAAVVAALVRQRDRALLGQLVEQVSIQPGVIAVRCNAAAIAAVLNVGLRLDAADSLTLKADVQLTRTGHVMRLIQRDGAAAAPAADPALLRQLIRARRWWQELRSGEIDVTTLAAREGIQNSYVTRVLRLAFLSPAVVDAILAGRQRPSLSIATLVTPGAIAADWRMQAAVMLPTNDRARRYC